MQTSRKKKAGGRPPKFDEPRRVITITLPERTLEQLASISPDRAVAITKAVDGAVGGKAAHKGKLVDLVQMMPGVALIVVAHSRCLSQLPWLRLVEIAPARNLIALTTGTEIEVLELAIQDLLEDVPGLVARERALLEELRRHIKGSRRNKRITKGEILFVDV